MLPFAIAVGGSECNPRFFQLLFESQSSSLVTELFMGEMSKPLISNSFECFLTAWCVANSNATSRWSLCFNTMLMLKNFADFFERFGCYLEDQQHGAIVGLVFDTLELQQSESHNILMRSLPSLFPCLEYLRLHTFNVDLFQLVPLFYSIHKLVSLKVLSVSIGGHCDEFWLPAPVSIPAQHCPSLLVLGLIGRASSFLFQSFVVPNINTQTSMLWCTVTSSNLSNLCSSLCQTTSLKWLELVDTDLTTHEAKELASALEQNRSLETVKIDGTVTISDEGIRILRKVLSSHPTLDFIEPYDTQMATALSQSMQDKNSAATSVDENERLFLPESTELNNLDSPGISSDNEGYNLQLVMALGQSEEEQKNANEEHDEHEQKRMKEKKEPQLLSESEKEEQRRQEEEEQVQLAMALSDLEKEKRRKEEQKKKEEEQRKREKEQRMHKEEEELQLAIALSESEEEERRKEEQRKKEEEEQRQREEKRRRQEEEEQLQLAMALNESKEKRRKEKEEEEQKKWEKEQRRREEEEIQLAMALSTEEEKKRKEKEEEQRKREVDQRRQKEEEELQLAMALSESEEENRRKKESVS